MLCMILCVCHTDPSHMCMRAPKKENVSSSSDREVRGAGDVNASWIVSISVQDYTSCLNTLIAFQVLIICELGVRVAINFGLQEQVKRIIIVFRFCELTSLVVDAAVPSSGPVRP